MEKVTQFQFPKTSNPSQPRLHKTNIRKHIFKIQMIEKCQSFHSIWSTFAVDSFFSFHFPINAFTSGSNCFAFLDQWMIKESCG